MGPWKALQALNDLHKSACCAATFARAPQSRDMLVLYAIGLLFSPFTGGAEATSTLQSFNRTLGGRLFAVRPFSAPCFGSGSAVSAECAQIQANYRSGLFRADHPGSFMNTQWESCQKADEQCQLDSSDPTNPVAYEDSKCEQGNVPPLFLEVQNAADVQAAFRFSRASGVRLAVKNTGHDYKGRSAGRGSLALWTHKLDSLSFHKAFIPSGCPAATAPRKAITLGSGVVWQDAYTFADSHNVTIVGGYAQSVGASGGWLMGGGHSVLSPHHGLGVDRVLEFTVVTPDAEVRVANACQHPDLFWALRGGGGGTFGVVLSSTQLVEDVMPLTVVSTSWTPVPSAVPELLRILVGSIPSWTSVGWGGHVYFNSVINVHPTVTVDEAKLSYADLVNFIRAHNGTVVIERVPSWLAFFNQFVVVAQSGVGAAMAIGSRLIPEEHFGSAAKVQEVADMVVSIYQETGSSPGMLLTTPYKYNFTPGATSMTPSWRTAPVHLSFVARWQYNATTSDIRKSYQTLHSVVQRYRSLAPDSGAYQNECDVHEVSHEQSFWGDNHARLLQIKQKYDPHHLLDCWQCVGWKGASDPLFACYL